MTTPDANLTPPPEASPPPRRRRRPWRFSLRGAMLLVLLVGGPIGWEANRVSRMRHAVAVLERPVAGEEAPLNRGRPGRGALTRVPSVLVLYDDLWWDGKYQIQPDSAWLPLRVREAIGEDHFRRVTLLLFHRRPTPEDWEAIAALGSIDVQFRSMPVTDADLGGLARCGSLVGLDLDGTEIIDATLGPIGRLTSLRRLELSQTATTAAGSAALSGLTRLEELSLGNRAGTDEGLAHLRGLTRLRELLIAGREFDVGDAGLAHLAGMADLEVLTFLTSRATAAGLSHLVGLPKLRDLEIQTVPTKLVMGLDVKTDASGRGDSLQQFWQTPEGAEPLGRLTHLERLSMGFVPIGDDCLRAIGRLTGLRELEVGSPQMTDAGIAALANLRRLEKLTLSGSQMTDNALRSLGELPELETLTLVEAPSITDSGLAYLRTLPHLENLTVPSQITPEGIEAFQASMPRRINIDQLPPTPHRAAPTPDAP